MRVDRQWPYCDMFIFMYMSKVKKSPTLTMGKTATNHWFIPSKMLDFLISLADLDLHNLPNPGLLVPILGVSVFGPISPMDSDTSFFQIQGRGKRRHSPSKSRNFCMPNFTSAIYVTSTFFCRFCLNFDIVHSKSPKSPKSSGFESSIFLWP